MSEWYDRRSKTKVRKTMRKQLIKAAFTLLCVLGLLAGKERNTAYAKEEKPADMFTGDVAMLKQEHNGYVMQVTVGNSGADFTGTVQVIFAGFDSGNCAYQTQITLPSQGKKQFTINITDTAADTTRGGACALNFLDEKGEILQSIELGNVLEHTITETSAGVLSDDFAGLSFMEADGETINIQNRQFPMKLMELNEENLREHLDELYYLIIDRFDVSSLGDENIEAIQDWVKDGGWLMIGTGEYADKTLSGFDKDFLDVGVLEISVPGEENIASAQAEPFGYSFTMYTNDGVDFTNMAIAELDYGSFFESSDHPAICGSIGNGGAEVYFFSFSDAELQKLNGYTVASMYEDFQNFGYKYDEYSEWEYSRERALSFIDKINTNVNFTWLKVMILVYVVLVGPVLYLILRRCKKCEWYWIGVPVLGVLFIAGVYFLGQGARVKETKVYSVTAQRADGDRKDTYFMAYQAGTKPWEVRLHTDYGLAGPGSGGGGYSYGSYIRDVDDYFYTVSDDGDGLLAGIKPEENFDSGMFYAEGSTKSRGEISCEDLKYDRKGTIAGKITNGTDCDMSYMAVWYQDDIMVFSDVKAGETIDLKRDKQNGKCVFDNTFYYVDDLLYDMVSVYRYRTDLGYEQDDMAALLVGLGIAESEKTSVSDQLIAAGGAKPSAPEQAVIVGVVRDYDRVTEGKYSEISYGCLYSFEEIEGGRYASH